MRIMVFGDVASGKSTFSEKLSKQTGIPVIHMDQEMERIGRVNKSQILAFIKNAVEKESWIIEGNAFTKDKDGHRIRRADQIFVFKTNNLITFWRYLRRYFKIRFGKERRVGSQSNSLSISEYFPYIFWQFPSRREAQIKLATSLGKKITFIQNYKSADNALRTGL